MGDCTACSASHESKMQQNRASASHAWMLPRHQTPTAYALRRPAQAPRDRLPPASTESWSTTCWHHCMRQALQQCPGENPSQADQTQYLSNTLGKVNPRTFLKHIPTSSGTHQSRIEVACLARRGAGCFSGARSAGLTTSLP